MEKAKIKQAKKSLGQHFLVDPIVIEKIVSSIAPSNSDFILEIGPGRGAITVPILKSDANLIAVEIDNKLSETLKAQNSSFKNFSIINQDFLSYNIHNLQLKTKNKWKIIGNLPYNVSVPIILKLLEKPNIISKLILMVQKEVADRIIAPCGSRTYGRLSVMVQKQATANILFSVNEKCFFPPPSVKSSVIELIPKTTNTSTQFDTQFSQIVTQAFSMRRKTIANALKKVFTKQQLQDSAIKPGDRPENLTVTNYEKLTENKLKYERSK